MPAEKKYKNYKLEYWGGIECTINRVEDSYFDQCELSGHYDRAVDIELISTLGIKVLRYPVLWEKHQPLPGQPINFTFTNKRLNELNAKGITPVVGLLHHGSGPSFTNLLDENFPGLFAGYAKEVAENFPWVQYYTPINEPLTTARFSGLYGLWYPHKKNDVSFVKMLLNQVKAIILAMQEIRKINPQAMLVQTEDLSKTYSTSSLKYQAAFENERRWCTYDLLCGKIRKGHAMWNYFTRLGISEKALNFFIDNAMPPDIMGFNYYVTSERFLDDDLIKYPPHTHGGNELQEYADAEAIRVNHGNPFGLSLLLKEAWERYHLPIAITEAHLNAGREDQLRWLNEIRTACHEALENGVDVKAITFWSLFGAFGWNKLLTSANMDYEPGAFDLQSSLPRPTAIARLITSIIREKEFPHSLLEQKGWWHHPERFYYNGNCQRKPAEKLLWKRPLVITGKTGTLGQAIGKVCSSRNIPYILTGRDDLDISEEKSIGGFLDEYKPWAIINTAGYVRVEDAEEEQDKCFESNTTGAVLLCRECKKRNISFVTISSDLVFNGKKNEPYLEDDPVDPLNIYGASKAKAEETILHENPDALIVRTSAFFGPWDMHNFAFNVLNSLSKNNIFTAADDVIVSPTYAPHLAEALLTLLIDDEKGIWHLANEGAITWKDFAIKIADQAGYNSGLIIGKTVYQISAKASIPLYSVLASKRGSLMPSLDQAIKSFFKECITLPKSVLISQHSQKLFD
ncbi:MAG: family 1 glycosylhydrolase [Ginsengibacter sp.]